MSHVAYFITQACKLLLGILFSLFPYEFLLLVYYLTVYDTPLKYFSFNFLDTVNKLSGLKPDESLKKYKCPYCPYSTNVSSHLQDHKRKHTGERPFKSDICGNAFAQKITLTRHYFTHTGERPFSCDYCMKGFTLRVNLKNHKCRYLLQS